MKLFVGLGNPGAKHAGNRHNIGYMAVDRIALDHGFGAWRAKHHGETSEGSLGGEKVVLLKPGTFMNLSGQSVGEAARFYRLAPADITVFHDELDLAPGKVRFKAGGGHAGHNGLRSLHQHIGDAYGRVRLGIGHPGHRDAVSPYVLSDFARAERDWLDNVLRGVSDGAPALAAGDAKRFMTAVTLRIAPARGAADGPARAAPRDTPRHAGRDNAPPGPREAPPGPGADTGSAGEGASGGILRALLERFRP